MTKYEKSEISWTSAKNILDELVGTLDEVFVDLPDPETELEKLVLVSVRKAQVAAMQAAINIEYLQGLLK